MQWELFNYLYSIFDFDIFINGFSLTDSVLWLITLVLTFIVAFLPIGLIIKVIKGLF